MPNVFNYNFINLFPSLDLTPKRLPLMVADSGVPGPTIWLCAAIHGDEVTGTAVIHDIFRKVERDGLKQGKILSFPVLNPLGFEFAARLEPHEEEDLNRQFPGDEKGSVADRLANVISETILRSLPDAVIDLHCDSDNSVAYGILDFFGDMKNEAVQKSIEIANILRLPFALSTSETEGYDISKSLSGYMVARKIPAITLELGAPMYISPRFERVGVSALLNYFNHLGMLGIDEPFESPHFKMLEGRLHKFTEKITTSQTGIIKYKVAAGEKIAKDQILGNVRDVFGRKIEIIRARRDGILLSHDDQAITFPGQSLFTMIAPL